MNSIEVHNLSKTFGDIEAVKDVSFDVKKGEIFAFLGPNGAGKSTTIKMLTTLLHPTSGTMRVDEKDPIRSLEDQRHALLDAGVVEEQRSGRAVVHLERLLDDVVEGVAEGVGGTAVDRLDGDALEDVGQPVVEAADVALGIVQLDAVVGALGDLVVVDVDRAAARRGEGVDGIGETADPVVGDHVTLAADLYAARILDAFRARPDRRPLDQVVGDEPAAQGVVVVAGGGDAVFGVMDVAVADHDAGRFVCDEGPLRAADRQALEPDVVGAAGVAAGEQPRIRGDSDAAGIAFRLVCAPLHPQQWRAVPPWPPASPPGHLDDGVLVVITSDDPMHPERMQGWCLEHWLAGGLGGIGCRSGERAYGGERQPAEAGDLQ